MRLKDIMTSEVQTIKPTEAAEVAWQKMNQHKIHHLVVMEGSHVVGVISPRDLGGPHGEDVRKNRNVGDLMTNHVICGNPTMTVKEAANVLRGQAIGCLPVVHDGKLDGIVTISDLLELVGKGVEKPVVNNKRWTLRHRGMGRKR